MNEPVRICGNKCDLCFDAEARASGQSQDAVVALAKAYANAGEADRSEMNDVLVDWLGSSAVAKRYDARYLVRLFNVRTALPALENLALRLEATPGAFASTS